MQISKTLITIFAAIFIPTILIGSELLGQGIDVIYAYKTIPNTIWRPLEAFGFIMATLTVSNFYLGVYSCSFLLTSSLAFFFKKAIYRQYYIYIFYIIGISFSWPLLLASNNALRQGVSIALTIFIVAIFKNIKNNFKKNILFLITLTLLAFSHKYGHLSLIFITSSFLIPKNYKSVFIPLINSIVIVGTLIIFGGEQLINYDAPGSGLQSQYFLIPIVIIYNFFYAYYFRNIDFYERIGRNINYSFILLSIYSFQNTAISERLLHFPIVFIFLTLPSFANKTRPKSLFSFLSISTVFFYMCMSLYYVGFKYYIE